MEKFRVAFIVPGEPKGKGRPRFNTKTGRTYTPGDTINYENLVKMQYQALVGDKYTKKEVSRKKQIPEEKLKEAIVGVGKTGVEVLEGFNKVVKEKKMSNLKVINEVVKVVSRELEGEFGKYIADENGVTREDITFKDLEAVEKYKKEQLEKFEREIAELEAVFTFREN